MFRGYYTSYSRRPLQKGIDVYKTTHKTANDLLVNDQVKLGGLMYIIKDVRKSFDDVTIVFYPTADTNNVEKLVLVANEYVVFKVYIQK